MQAKSNPKELRVTKFLGVLTALCGLLAIGWLARGGGHLHAGQTENQVRRGSMALQWRDEVKTSSAPTPHDVITITKQLNAKVVFEVSEEQLMFFDPNYMKGSPIPITHGYVLSNAAGSPSFGGPLEAKLIKSDGQGNYTREEHDDSGNYHLRVSGAGQAGLSALIVTFQGGNFFTVAASAMPIAATINGSSMDGTSSHSTTYTSGETAGIELTLKQGAPPPGWTVSVNHKPGTYRYVVNANLHQSGPMGDSLYVEETASLSLLFDLSGEEELEAVLIPLDDGKPENEKYANWVPEAGNDESAPGNYLEVRVVLQPKGQAGKLPSKTAKFRFELMNVSHEPGVCLNWPPKPQAKSTPDLRIDTSPKRGLTALDQNGQSVESKEGLTEFLVTIDSYDYGAWGKLKVTAILDDGTTVVAHLKDKPDQESLAIPKDDNNNHIADAWEHDMGLSGDVSESSDDDDSPAGDGTKGDGLSTYEEYRGFQVQGSHIRTNPKMKDLFVYDQDDMTLGYFAVSGLALHSLRVEEFTFDTPEARTKNPWVINFNSGFGNLGKQHVLFFRNASLGDGTLGDSGPLNPGPPKTTYWVKVDVAYSAKLGGVQELESTIGHELAHRTNVWHHGDKDYEINKAEKELTAGNWAEMLKAKADDSWTVSAQGGQSSGDADRIMRYELIDFYEWNAGPFRWTKPAVGLVRGGRYRINAAPGTTFCASYKGTGVNGPGNPPVPLAGDATRGSCQRQICVNDVKGCTNAGQGHPGG